MSITHTDIHFIINPISGTSSKDEIVQTIPQLFDPTHFHTTIHYTQHPGHAAQLTRQAIDHHADIVVAIGGDGTVNEIARTLVHTPVALGIVPCGSGNGLGRHLGLPMTPRRALEVITQAHIKALDYGMINDQPFFCTAGVGFDALLSDKFNRHGRRGLLAYIEKALTEGLTYKPETYTLHIQGIPTTDPTTPTERHLTIQAFLITCANASQWGNDFYIAPQAHMSDGLMDVTIIEPFNPLESAQIAFQLVNHNIDDNPHVHTFKCRQLTIERAKPGVIHYDGDPKTDTAQVNVSIIPQGIHIVVNPNARPWQPLLQRAISDVNDQIRQTPHRINKINQDLLSRLRKTRE